MQLKSPVQITESVLGAGRSKLALRLPQLIVSSMLAGAYIALGGALSTICGFGFPEITAANPGLQKIISGATFPIGLILVVVLGAELFTGNNAVLIPGLMRREHGWRAVLANWSIVWTANFAGALLFVGFLVAATGIFDTTPYREALTAMAVKKTSLPWLTVFFRGIGANWCVCLAVWLALSGHSLTEKMAGCWFPVMAFVALGYEHSIANMFFIPTGMMLGAPVSVGSLLLDNLLPATLGNIAGGALFVGCVYGWIHLKKSKKKSGRDE